MSIDVKEPSGDAIVGVEYVFPSEIATEYWVSKVKVSVTLVTDKVWKPIYFTPGSAALITTESFPFTGRIIESKFEMKVPGGSEEQLANLNLICSRPVVLRIVFERGATLICGGKNRKLRLATDSTLDTKKGNVVKFEYKSKSNFMWEAI